ncbi:MAG: Ig-like domain-containing protein [Ilumatobacteraceae bacterium]
MAAVATTALLSSVVVVAAVKSNGSAATNVRLDDGTVWVTNAGQRLVGRLNLKIDELDFAVLAADNPDVLQDGRNVVFSGRQGGVAGLDVLKGKPTAGRNEIPMADYWIGGGVGAVADSDTGKLWVGPAGAPVAPEYPKKPDALVDPGSQVLVTQADRFTDVDGKTVTRGHVIVVGPDGWHEVNLGDDLKPLREGYGEPTPSSVPGTAETTVPSTTLPPTTEGDEEPDPDPLYEADVHDLGVSLDDIADITAVGPVPVVLTTDGAVAWTDGKGHAHRAGVPGTVWQLQQAGPAAKTVLVASDEGLFQVALNGDDDAKGAAVLAAAEGQPSQPVRTAQCVYGAWSNDAPSWFKRCSGGTVVGPTAVPGAQPGQALVWRVNQNNVALNQPGKGDVWADHDGTLSWVGNWDDVKPSDQPPDQEHSTTGDSQVEVERICQYGGDAAPRAGDDQLGVRPRQSVMDLLNNDDDDNCEPLAIASLTPDHGEWGALTIIDNGQHVLYSPSQAYLTGAEQQILPFTFTYTVKDPRGHESAPATVNVTVAGRAAADNPPALRPKGDKTREMKAQVEEGKTVVYDVSADWWDHDGDDLTLVNAVPLTDGSVSYTPDGKVTYQAFGVGSGSYNVEVTMSDGVLQTTETMTVTVKSTGSSIPPVAADDFLTLAQGTTATIDLLANDSDGNDDPLQLVPKWAASDAYQAVVLHPGVDGQVQVTGVTPGVYQLDYEASDGTGVSSRAALRLEVLGPQENNTAPVAVPDHVTLRPGRILNVEVLSNDVDHDGDLLGVVGVDVSHGDETAGVVHATVIDRRMLQVEVVPGSTGKLPTGDFQVFYTVSDGHDSDRAQAGQSADDQQADQARERGALTIHIQDPSLDQHPQAVDDVAVVRAGGLVTVPVLRNDVDPDSDEIMLTRIVPNSEAAFEQELGGVAWVDGRDVHIWGLTPRAQPYAIDYEIVANGVTATGQISLTVKAPADDADNVDNAPQMPVLEMRAVRNSAVRLQVPSNGLDVDQDGDTVTVTAVGPSAGGVVPTLDPAHPNVITYEAKSLTPADDTFTYTADDGQGKTAQGTVRVLVLDPQNWSPVAHDDVWRAKPGRTLNIDVLANDVSPSDLALKLADSPFFDADGQPSATPLNPDAVSLPDQTDPKWQGFVQVTVPGTVGTLVEQYRVVDAQNRNAKASIRVTPDPDAPGLPPVAGTDTVGPAEVHDQQTVPVDVLKNDMDPDGDPAGLTIEAVALSAGTSVVDNQLVVPVLDHAQTVLYKLIDTDGLFTYGVVDVAGDVNHPPELSDEGADPNARVIEAADPQPMTLDLARLATDPDGQTDIRLTDQEITLTPGSPGEIKRIDDTHFQYSPPQQLDATTVVTVAIQVTDRPDLDSQARLTTPNCNCLADLVVPITLRAQTPPVVNSPGALGVPQLDEEEVLDVTPLTTDAEGDPLTYVFDTGSTGGLTVTASGPNITVVSHLGGDKLIPVGTVIPINYTVSDGHFDPVHNVVNVKITDTNKPPPVAGSVGPFTDAERGVTYSKITNLVSAAYNPFGASQPMTLTAWSVSPAGTIDCTAAGACTFTSPSSGDNAVGEFTVTYTLTDAAHRTAQGSFVLGVKGKPLAPGVPQVVSVADHTVNLRWDAADMQLGAFQKYVVTAVGDDGHTVSKDSDSTSVAFAGLHNAVAYRFTVVAWNELGQGVASSPSSPGTPDRVPDPPQGLAFTDYQDGSLSFKWEVPPTAADFSQITNYGVQLIGGPAIDDQSAGTLSLTIAGLTNGQQYSFKVRAKNATGWGAWSTVQSGSGTGPASGRPSRYPDKPAPPTAANSGDGGSPRITVKWGPPGNDGGRAIDHYSVCMVGGTCQTIPAGTTQATFNATRAQSTAFTVEAFNTDKNRNNSGPSDVSAPVTAVGNPDPPTITSITSGDHSLTVVYNQANNSGCGSASWQFAMDGGGWSNSPTFNGLINGSSHSFVARTLLASSCGTPGTTYASTNSNTASGVPYGPLRTPSISASGGGTTTITWNWATNRADDERPGWNATLSGDCGGQTLSSNQGATGSVSQSYGRDGSNRSCTITVSAPGQGSLSATANAHVQDPPPASISASASGSLYSPQPSGCNGGCVHVVVSGSNFNANSPLQVYCESTTDNYVGPYSLGSTDGSGAFGSVSSTCADTPGNAQKIKVVDGGGKTATTTAS